jgi:hypothetical protein
MANGFGGPVERPDQNVAAVKATQVLNKRMAETKAFAAAIGLSDKDDEKAATNDAVERKCKGESPASERLS